MGKTIKIRVIFMKETAQFIHIETYADIKEREKKQKSLRTVQTLDLQAPGAF